MRATYDARDEFILHTVADGTFCDVAGPSGFDGRWASLALEAGARAATVIAPAAGDDLPAGVDVIDAALDDPSLLERAGTFDVVHCDDALAYDPAPLRTLAQLRRLTRGHLVLTSMILPEATQRPELRSAPGQMLFVPDLAVDAREALAEHFGGLGACWWIPTAGALRQLLLAAGWLVLAEAELGDGAALAMLATPADAPAAAVLAPTGEVNAVREGSIRGWARPPGGHGRCRVSLEVDGEVVDAQLADRPTDAQQHACGFAFPLPAACFAPGRHELRVLAGDPGQPLGDEPLVIDHDDPSGTLLSALQRAEFNLAAEGWAFDPETPDERFTVSVFIDGEYIDSAEATRARTDLQRLGYSDGRLGYVVPIPERYFDGRTHTIHALIDERLRFTRNSGLTFGRDEVARGLVRRMGRRLDSLGDILR